MKRIWALGFVALSSLSVWGQATYSLRPSVQGFSALTIGVLTAVNIPLQANLDGLTLAELDALSEDDVPIWDRYPLGRWDESAINRSDVTTYGALGLGAASALRVDDFSQTMVLGTLWVEANLLNGMGTYVVKHSTRRIRPYAFGDTAPLEERMSPDARTAFFSGHTSVTAMNTFFAATVYSQTHPDSPWVPWVWTAAAVVPAYTAWQRVEAGKHYPSDVVAGYVFGAVIGYLIPTIHLD